MRQFHRRFIVRKHKSTDSPREQSDVQNIRNGDTGPASEAELPRDEESIAFTGRDASVGNLGTASGSQGSSQTGVNNPLGLTVVHRPQGERKIDIVFVHGLGGTSRLTWSKNKDPDLFWPQKFLPQEPGIDQARILTFGYNADFLPGSGKSITTILDFAKDLLFEMKYAQDDSDNEPGDLKMGQTPIIFVVHSMGGLLVKEAYIQGLHDPHYEGIVSSISAIVFLSTPHRGTNLAETLNRILQVSIGSAPKQFIWELSQNSLTLQKLNEQFRHVAGKLDIVSFYETRATPIGFSKVMVLEKDSSVLGYPGEISKPLDADHHGVCKYGGRQDPAYIPVRNVIRSLLNKFTASADAAKTNTQTPALNFKELLSVHEPPDNDFAFFRDRWTTGTCGWVLNHDSFRAWLGNTRNEPDLLWIHGNPGSGKSILSSFVIDHLTRSGKRCQYFFARFSDESKRSVHALLRSLSLQIAKDVPEYAAKLVKLASGGTNFKTSDVRNIWQWLFRDCICPIELASPIYWVIDGVDELDVPHTLVKLLSELTAFKVPVRLLLVSRKTHELSLAMRKLGKNLHMTQILVEGHPDDFKRFVDEEMNDIAGDEFHKSRTASLILERAKGNFLWVHLAVQRINKCVTQKDIKIALEELPPGMEALYDRMASTIIANPSEASRHLAYNIVAWTTCARRLMTVSELSEVLGDNAPLDMKHSIESLCGGFVVVDSDRNVGLIHQTAREYLFRDSNAPFGVRKQSANELLFYRCMSCLTASNLRAKINRNQEPDFLDYAASSWFVHLCLADSTSTVIVQTAIGFLKSPHVLTWIHAVAKSGAMHSLILASQYLTRFLKKHSGAGIWLSSHAEFATAHNTIERWANDIVKLVGRFGRSLVLHPPAIYKSIAPFCPHDSIIYQQFDSKGGKSLAVTGISNSSWDECLGRISLGQGSFTSSILAAGSRIGILSLVGRSSMVSIHNNSTFDEICQVHHSERVLKIHMNSSGTILLTYGYKTTKVWDLSTSRCIKSADNPPGRPWPHTVLFKDRDETLLVGFDDRRLRSLTMEGTSSQWEIMADFREQAQEGTIVNSPTCMALSPEGDLIALGYRGHPLSLWEVNEPSLIAQCSRALGDASGTTASESWGEVIQLTWHPFSGQIIGLYLEGKLFKWHPFEDENQEVIAGANKLALNHDGSLCVTGDAIGTIKIFHTADFSLFYHLCSEGPVLDLAFSLDCTRIYDVRGTYANIWEPNDLVRFVGCPDFPGHGSDTSNTSKTLLKPDLSLPLWSRKIDAVTAICAQSLGPLYCYGTEDGVVYLCERVTGAIETLHRSKSFMSIEWIAWSRNGKFVAFVDTNGKLVVKSVQASADGGPRTTSTVLETTVTVQGVITQLLFHPEGDKILISSIAGLCTISVNGTVIREVIKAGTGEAMKWAYHPTSMEYLLGFGERSLHIYDWVSLEEASSMIYDASRSNETSSPIETTDGWGLKKTVVKSLLTADSTRFLVEVSHLRPGTSRRTRYFLISLAAIDKLLSIASVGNSTLGSEMSQIGQALAESEAEIGLPLIILPRGRLVFLDKNFWLCTCHLPVNTNISRRHADASDTTTSNTRFQNVKRHYILPGDWISYESAALSCAFPDGTLLYPRKGEVAVIQSESLRQGL